MRTVSLIALVAIGLTGCAAPKDGEVACGIREGLSGRPGQVFYDPKGFQDRVNKVCRPDAYWPTVKEPMVQ